MKERYDAIHQDSGVQAAFGFLVALASSSQPNNALFSGIDPELEANRTPLSLARKLSRWIAEHADSQEYATLAQKAASDTIAAWTREQSRQTDLFGDSREAPQVWAKANNAEAFCEISRTFFAKFTERYLAYFLGREAGAEVRTIAERRSFDDALERHVADVSRHAFEMSQITQSFSAGWYNNHARNQRPSDNEIGTFLRIAFGKLKEELLREERG